MVKISLHLEFSQQIFNGFFHLFSKNGKKKGLSENQDTQFHVSTFCSTR